MAKILTAEDFANEEGHFQKQHKISSFFQAPFDSPHSQVLELVEKFVHGRGKIRQQRERLPPGLDGLFHVLSRSDQSSLQEFRLRHRRLGSEQRLLL